MPSHIREVRVVGEAPEVGIVDIHLVDPDTDTVDITISDEQGRLLAWLPGTRFGALRDRAAPADTAAQTESGHAEEPVSQGGTDARLAWHELPLEILPERIADEIASRMAREMKIPLDELDRDQPLTELGLDSVMSVVVCGKLEKLLVLQSHLGVVELTCD
ncbi:acyl carrier protein [Streptomyces sp. L500]